MTNPGQREPPHEKNALDSTDYESSLSSEITPVDAQASDLSVDYPMVVEHYRAAHEIDQNGERTDTEELRKAMQHYHVLFGQIIGDNIPLHAQEAL